MNIQDLDISIVSALEDFEKSSAPGVWSSLEKNQVLTDIKVRLLDAFKVNQGQQPFCGPASILFELVRKQPLRYVQICRSLFETGSFQGQTRRIEASQRLRQSRGKLGMGQADWMVLATWRESENLIFPVEPDAPEIIRNIAGMTKSWEMKGWTREVLGYRNVKYFHTYLLGDTIALNQAAKILDEGGVAFALITSQGLLGKIPPLLPYPTHWVTLLGNISIQQSVQRKSESGRISMDVYTWASQRRIEHKERRFKTYFWGIVMGSL
ncbi:MAG: hypothetical protein SAK29_20875 [Scytonema sp. PMC 1069.18]|nr:hypothetical protein [Scytonema sp. PMC 1069.18]MEC4886600.1 hypothetical protein [Scytonema sp. PMC 1070.18]